MRRQATPQIYFGRASDALRSRHAIFAGAFDKPRNGRLPGQYMSISYILDSIYRPEQENDARTMYDKRSTCLKNIGVTITARLGLDAPDTQLSYRTRPASFTFGQSQAILEVLLVHHVPPTKKVDLRALDGLCLASRSSGLTLKAALRLSFFQTDAL